MMINLLGQTFGSCKLTAVLGQGGMAVVYAGYQAAIDRVVAVKVLPKMLLLDPTFLERFTNEARTLAKLTHPAILPIYDFGEANGILYIIMPLMPNASLEARFRDGPMALPEVLRIIRPLAEALDYAHTEGTLHRDVKPSNVLFDQRDQPMLADFGIAKTLESATVGLTSNSIVIGTPSYMSPEQGIGLEVDARSDQYALGVVVYEALTGQLPFVANSPLGVIHKHATEAPTPPRQLRPDLSPAMEDAMLKVLAKQPEDRFPTVTAFADALANAAFLSRDFWQAGGRTSRTRPRPTNPSG